MEHAANLPDNVTLEIVTPESLLLSEDVAMVVAPGVEGDFGVLSGHVPFVSTLRPGIVTVYEAEPDVATHRYFVTGGFTEAVASRCTVLVEEARDMAHLTRDDVEKEIEQANRTVRRLEAEDATPRQRARARARLEAYETLRELLA